MMLAFSGLTPLPSRTASTNRRASPAFTMTVFVSADESIWEVLPNLLLSPRIGADESCQVRLGIKKKTNPGRWPGRGPAGGGGGGAGRGRGGGAGAGRAAATPGV